MQKNDSIIEVIQKMVQDGEPREKILKTLNDLGVKDEQATRLLMIAEADTLTLLKKEINNMVKQEFSLQKKDFEDIIKHDLKIIESEEKVMAGEVARSELKDVRAGIVGEAKGFEERVNKVISESQKTVSLVKVALDSLNNRMAQIELDVEQMKVHKFRKKSMFFSYAMLGTGALAFLVSLVLFWINFSNLDVANIVVLSILLLASITLMFASILG
ncbi:Uncharacterised protein [uncultured archaeon]|nr:Uncharacterised protein [uncultured archaeon]